MLEVIPTTHGDVSLCLDGKLLASKMNPRHEAQKWVDKNFESFLGIRSALVIGVGAGYHLSELKNQCPHLNIIGLENNKELVAHHEKSLELVRGGIKLICTSEANMFENKILQDALCGSYKVIVHSSAHVTYGSSAHKIKDTLNARNKAGFDALLEIRNCKDIAIKKTEAEILSILDLDFTGAVGDDKSTLHMSDVAPILMELIK